MAQVSACQGRDPAGWNPGFGGEAAPAPQRPHLAGARSGRFLLSSSPDLTFASSDGGFSIAYVHLSSFLSLQKACPGAGGSESERSDL